MSLGVPELVILLGLGLVFLSGFISETKHGVKEIPLLYQEIGTIGGVGFSYRHISLGSGFSLAKGVEGTPIISQPGPVEIAKGIFTTEEHVVEFDVPDVGELTTAKLEAEVVDTNRYGPLVVYLNGEEIWKGYAEKGQKVEVELPVEKLGSRNTLKIACSSSGWKIWAPNYYVLENVRITETVSSGEKVRLNFTLTDEELANFYSARFYSALDPKLPGEIAIVLNDEKVIYRGVPNQRAFMVPFSSGVRRNNKLEIQLLSDGAYEFREPQIVVLTQQNATAGVSLMLKIPAEYLTAMRAGKLVGEIEMNVRRTGETPLEVILSAEREKLLYRGIPKPGKLVLRFTGDEVSSENTVVLRSGSIYEIEYIKVRLVKP